MPCGGCSLDRLPPGQIGDDLLARLWGEVDKLHRAGIAHRSLRVANVMADPAGQLTIVDFSFSELDTTPLPSVRSSLASLGRVARSPVRLTLLFGGLAQVGAVYLVASLIAAASPTPGGLGAIEAATIAGLTGIGISSGPAVSAVLVYRLATYWLPVLPGWYSWRLLQRMDYL